MSDNASKVLEFQNFQSTRSCSAPILASGSVNVKSRSPSSGKTPSSNKCFHPRKQVRSQLKVLATFLHKTNCDWALPPVLSWTELLGCPVIASSHWSSLQPQSLAVLLKQNQTDIKLEFWTLLKKILGQGSLFPMP